MHIDELNDHAIAILKDTNNVLYLDDGTIDVDLLQQLIHRFDKATRHYNGLAYLYYILQLPLKEPKEIQAALTFWKMVIHKYPSMSDSIQSNLPHFDKYRLPYMQHIQWLMQAYPVYEDQCRPGRAMLELVSFGLIAYLHQQNTQNTSATSFLPPAVEQMTMEELLRVGLYNNRLDYAALIRNIHHTDSIAIRKCIVLFAFAAELRPDRGFFDVEKALELVWPQFEVLDISLKDALDNIQEIMKIPEFPMQLLKWSESAHAKKYPNAVADVHIFVQKEFQRVARRKKWTTDEFRWVNYASKLDPKDPQYTITRKKIAQAIIAEMDEDLTSIEPIDALSIALQSGKETVEELLEIWKNDGHSNIHEHLTSLFCNAPMEVARDIFNHPLMNEHIPAKTLLKSIYSPEKLEDDLLYAKYTSIHEPNSQYDTSQVAETIIKMSDCHKKLQDGTSFKDTIDLPLYVHFWSILGVEMYCATEKQMEYASHFFTQPTAVGIPIGLRAIMCLDPEFYRSHREDVARIITSSEPKDTVPIYQRWLTELFGPLYDEKGLQDLMIRDGKGVERFFTQLYIQRHPELGCKVNEALSVDGL